jgi:tetratricopeptide (TPR) repeat protein
MGLLLSAEGNLADARRMHEEALAIRRELGDNGRTALSIRELSGIRYLQGELREAQTGLEEALQIQLALGQKGQAAYTRTDLARVLTELGWPDRAEPAARLAIAEFRSEKAPDGESQALRALAEAQLAEGKLNDARSSIAAALRLADVVDPQSEGLTPRIVAARIDIASGKRDDARKALASVVSTAIQKQARGAEFSARLALAELEVKSGNAAAARGHLAALQKETTERGYVLLARKADALLQQLDKDPNRSP